MSSELTYQIFELQEIEVCIPSNEYTFRSNISQIDKTLITLHRVDDDEYISIESASFIIQHLGKGNFTILPVISNK